MFVIMSVDAHGEDLYYTDEGRWSYRQEDARDMGNVSSFVVDTVERLRAASTTDRTVELAVVMK